MLYLLSIFYIGLCLAPLFLIKFNIWIAQGYFSYIMISIMTAYSFWKEPTYKFTNKFITVFLIWCIFNVALYSYLGGFNVNNITQLLIFFNILFSIFVAKYIYEYLNSSQLNTLMNVFRWIIMATLILCVLQIFGLSQFYALFNPKGQFANNPCVGFIGQPTHLGGLLGMYIPILLLSNKRLDYLSLGLLSLILLFFTGSTKGDIALSGIVVAIASSAYYFFFTNRKAFWIGLCALPLILGAWYFSVSDYTRWSMFSDNGRIKYLQYFWGLFHSAPILGAGLGVINFIRDLIPEHMKGLYHIHLEFFQIAFELGVIGLGLFLLIVDNYFRIAQKHKEVVAMKACVFGFLVSCLFAYPMHIWFISMTGVFFYAATLVYERDLT